MKRDRLSSSWLFRLVSVAAVALIAGGMGTRSASADVDGQAVLNKLNALPTVAGSEERSSYKIIFDGYLALSPPPMEVGPSFNLSTIHNKMADWSKVSGWAESNAKMVEAILAAKDKTRFGLPYGEPSVDAKYRDAGLVAMVGANNSVHEHQFRYLRAVDTIAAFATAEVYRLMEANQVEAGLELAMAHIYVLRQLCDREFFVEKLHCIQLLSQSLSNLRDVFWVYLDKIESDQFARIAMSELPFLRPDRGRLFLPEADRIVSDALISAVFDSATARTDPEKFTSIFAAIQSKDAPLERFGAAKRWREIAAIHDSLDASRTRLNLIYDDWWRRWRVQEYDAILDMQTQFERTNPIRYAAVIYSIQDLESLFAIRNQLIVEVNGTAVAAGLCGYKRAFGTYPNETKMAYATHMRKRSDTDYNNKNLGSFNYMVVGSSGHAVDTPLGRVWVPEGTGLLWGVGQNHTDDRAATHTDDGLQGDIMIWPPVKALQREQIK